MIQINGRCLVLASLLFGNVLYSLDLQVNPITSANIIAARPQVKTIIKKQKMIVYATRTLVASAVMYAIYCWYKGSVEQNTAILEVQNKVRKEALEIDKTMQSATGDKNWKENLDVEKYPAMVALFDLQKKNTESVVNTSPTWGKYVTQVPGNAWNSVKNICSLNTIKNTGSFIRSFFTYEYLSQKAESIATHSVLGVTAPLLYKGIFGMPTIQWFTGGHPSCKVTAVSIARLINNNLSLQAFSAAQTLRKQVVMLSAYLSHRVLTEIKDEYERKLMMHTMYEIVKCYNGFATVLNAWDITTGANKRACIDALRTFVKMTDGYIDYFMTVFEEKIEVYDPHDEIEVFSPSVVTDDEMIDLSEFTTVLANIDNANDEATTQED